MAYLTETGKWEEGVYQWETQDPVVGGPDGIDNVPTRQLANRTGYLKALVEAHAAATDPHSQYTTESEVHALVEVTQPQFDNSKKAATTEFVQRALGNYSSVYELSAGGTLNSTAWGSFIALNATSDQTLIVPGMNVVGRLGLCISFFNWGTGTFTLQLPAGSTSTFITADGNHQTIAIAIWEWVSITTDGANYFVQRDISPTAPQFDNSSKNATTAFVQRALGNSKAGLVLSGNVALTAAQAGSVISCNGGTLTLPLYSSVPAGATFLIQAAASTIIKTTGADAFWLTGPGSVSSLTLNMGDWVIVTAVSQWEVMAGSLVAGTAPLGDNSMRGASTAFVQRALGNKQGMIGVSGGGNVNLSDLGKTIALWGSAAYTITLPATASVPEGGVYEFFCTNGAGVSVAVPSGDSFTYGSGANTQAAFVLYGGDSIILVKAGTAWYVVGGSIAPKYSSTALTSPGFFGSPTAPTPPQFDNSARLATTAFAQRAVGYTAGIATFQADGALTAVHAGYLIGLGSDATHSLTMPAGIAAGYRLTLINWGAGTWTLKTGSGSFIGNGVSAANSMAVSGGGSAQIIYDGANWLVIASQYQTSPAVGDNSTRVATTAFLKAVLASGPYITSPKIVGGWTSTSSFASVPANIDSAAFVSFRNDTGIDGMTFSATDPRILDFAIGSDGRVNIRAHALVLNALSVGLAQTPAQFDNSPSVASTAFVQRALGSRAGVIGFTSSATLTAASAGSLVSLGGTGSQTLTLPAPSTPGMSFVFNNWNGAAWSIATPSGGFGGPGGGGNSVLPLPAYCVTEIIADGGNWIVTVSPYAGAPAADDNSARKATTSWVRSAISNIVNGSFLASLASAAGLAFYTGTTGYIKFPSWIGGLILQWGIAPASETGSSATNTVRVTYPVSFPNATLAAFTSFITPQGSCSCGVSSSTAQACNVSYANLSGMTLTLQSNFIALGY
jgi:hypothetical protein